MTRVLNIEDTVCSVLHEALDCENYAEVDTASGLGIFDELRHDVPQARIVTISLSAILTAVAVQESARSEDE
jgi:hypothetical protein